MLLSLACKNLLTILTRTFFHNAVVILLLYSGILFDTDWAVLIKFSLAGIFCIQFSSVRFGSVRFGSVQFRNKLI